MSIFTDIIPKMPHSENMPDISQIKVPQNYDEYLKWQCEISNRTAGNLEGYDCPECMNRGYISAIRDDVIVQRECRCMKVRRNLVRLKNSGLSEFAQRCTFENFETPYDWQKRAKAKVVHYVRENTDKWLFFGGQSGCGKTHLCTAVCTEIIGQGHDVKYVLWRNLVHFLESNRFNKEKDNPSSEGRYNDKISELQDADVLYIDDFLKTTHKVDGKTTPSETELNSAYEIINARTISGKKTIISSEMHISDISALDEATGGRIAEKSKGFQIQIKRGKDRNFRFYEEE